MVLELREDGTYHLYVEEDKLDETFNGLKTSVVPFYEDYLLLMLCDTFAENGVEGLSSWEDIERVLMTDKETIIFNGLGMSIPEFVDQLFSKEAEATIFATVEREGRYFVEPGKLHMSASLDSEPKDGDYESFALADDVLVLTDYSGTSLAEGMVYPMTFQRIG